MLLLVTSCIGITLKVIIAYIFGISNLLFWLFSFLHLIASHKGCCTANTPTKQLPSGHFGTVFSVRHWDFYCLSHFLSPPPSLYGCQSGPWPVRQAVGCDGRPRLLPQPPPLLYPPHPTWPGTHHWPSGDSCQRLPSTNLLLKCPEWLWPPVLYHWTIKIMWVIYLLFTWELVCFSLCRDLEQIKYIYSWFIKHLLILTSYCVKKRKRKYPWFFRF